MRLIIEINNVKYEVLDFIGEPVQVCTLGQLEYVYKVVVTEYV